MWAFKEVFRVLDCCILLVVAVPVRPLGGAAGGGDGGEPGLQGAQRVPAAPFPACLLGNRGFSLRLLFRAPFQHLFSSMEKLLCIETGSVH